VNALARTLALALSLSPAAAATGERLVIASCDFQPFYGESMKDAGPVAKVTRLALEAAGYQVEVRFLPWARVLKEGQAGKVDVIFGLWRSAEREAWIAFSEPVLENQLGLMRRRGGALTETTLEGLKARGAVVGSVRGYANPPAVAASGVALEEASADDANVRKLLANQIQVALIDRSIGAYLAGQLGKGAEVEWITTLESRPMFDGVVKTSGKDWRRILADFNREYAKLKAAGTVAAVFREYALQQ